MSCYSYATDTPSTRYRMNAEPKRDMYASAGLPYRRAIGTHRCMHLRFRTLQLWVAVSSNWHLIVHSSGDHTSTRYFNESIALNAQGLHPQVTTRQILVVDSFLGLLYCLMALR